MSYRFVYPNCASGVSGAPTTGYGMAPGVMAAGYPNGMATNMYGGDYRRRSYSPGSFSSDSDSNDDYEYRGRVITRETRCPRDVIRAPTPPPIIKRVVERAPTPEPPVMERVIIRPQAQEIVERVIEQPRTPPPRIIQKEMHEEAPPPIVRTRVIKVDRPIRSGYSQPGSPYCFGGNGLQSFSNGVVAGGQPFRTHSIAGSLGRPMTFANHPVDANPSFSSGESFDFGSSAVPAGQQMTMMMPPTPQAQHLSVMSHQQPQPIGVMQQAGVQPMSVMTQQLQQMSHMPQQVQQMGMMQPGQQQQQPQLVYRTVQMKPVMRHMTPQSVPPLPTNYMPQSYMYPGQQGMSFGYQPMMQQGGVVPSAMPMSVGGSPYAQPPSVFPSQQPMFNSMPQQLVY